MTAQLTTWVLIFKSFRKRKCLSVSKSFIQQCQKQLVSSWGGTMEMWIHTLGTSSFVFLACTRKKGKHKHKMSWVICHYCILQHHVHNPVKFPRFKWVWHFHWVIVEHGTQTSCTFGDEDRKNSCQTSLILQCIVRMSRGWSDFFPYSFSLFFLCCVLSRCPSFFLFSHLLCLPDFPSSCGFICLFPDLLVSCVWFQSIFLFFWFLGFASVPL